MINNWREFKHIDRDHSKRRKYPMRFIKRFRKLNSSRKERHEVHVELHELVKFDR